MPRAKGTLLYLEEEEDWLAVTKVFRMQGLNVVHARREELKRDVVKVEVKPAKGRNYALARSTPLLVQLNHCQSQTQAYQPHAYQPTLLVVNIGGLCHMG